MADAAPRLSMIAREAEAQGLEGLFAYHQERIAKLFHTA